MNPTDPAFARTYGDAERRERASKDLGYDHGYEGLTTRAYFAVRAPAAVPDWFKPVMPPEPQFQGDEPKFIGDPATFNKKDRERYDDYQLRLRRYQDAMIAWAAQVEPLRVAQWPWAWADLVLGAQ